ncbi:MBL fold hydrolase [Candidatus Wolfebacteria bacterium]|nr:MAG: MBL fold hydrolase [Candidatus Wolfebacteria bacterium]
MKNNLALTLYGGVGSVTGANFLLESEADNFRLLVDCGLIQGVKNSIEENSKPFGYEPATIKVLLITHAHLDHVGRIPKLFKDGFSGVIYSTPATKEMAELILRDSVRILSEKAKEEGKEPMYSTEHVDAAMFAWQTVKYHTEKDIGGGFSIYMKDAGHILGSAMIEITHSGKKVVFTGDLGNSPSPLLRDTEEVNDADYMVMESVYGDRNHEDRDQRREKFKRIVQDSIKRGGALLIPAFSIERTQILLHEINDLVESGAIPEVPVFLDSPLAIKVTRIYKDRQAQFNKGVRDEIASGDDIFNFPNLTLTETREESKKINNVPNPKIIIAGSGMSSGGRIIYHEERYLPDPNSTVILPGYQAVGTRGRHLDEGLKIIDIKGRKIQVKARIEKITGFSGHKDSEHLVEFVADTKDTVKKVFVAMGETKASLFLVQRLRDYLEVDAIHPEVGKKYILE